MIRDYLYKGYKLTGERSTAALAATGGRHYGSDYYERYHPGHANDAMGKEWLASVPKGKPGLSIHRDTSAQFGRITRAPGVHTIVYRDRKGVPVTMAQVQTHTPDYSSGTTKRGPRLSRPNVQLMASDRSRGALHAIGVGHVARVLGKMSLHHGAMASHDLTTDSQKFVAHAYDANQSRLLNYMKRRQARGR